MTDAPAERRPGRGRLAGLGPYLVAGALYVALGVWEPRVLLSWAEGIAFLNPVSHILRAPVTCVGIAFLMLVVWAIPASIRQWRR